jgi:hypothetical protein
LRDVIEEGEEVLDGRGKVLYLSYPLELKVDEHAYPGTKRMTLEGEKYDYPVSIETVESGF